MKHVKMALSAATAVALLMLAGPDAAQAEVVSGTVEDAPQALEGVDLMAPELHGDEQVAPLQTPKPDVTLTPEPETSPSTTPIPWYTSVHYPAEKVSFEDEIWAALTGRWGLAEEQAAGLMGNIRAECGFSPYKVEGRGDGRGDGRGVYALRTDDGVGFGLGQWTSEGRKSNLLDFALSRGGEALAWDLDTQLEFMALEMDLDALRRAESLYEATEWVTLWYERPNQRYANSWPGVRYEYARAIYEAHTGRPCAEPKLRFRVGFRGERLTNRAVLALKGGRAQTHWQITVSSNYYWRLYIDEAQPEDWLTVRCPALYHPDRMEDCVCGYACDEDKPLTLSLARELESGDRCSAVLRFEIYLGEPVVGELPIIVTCPPDVGGIRAKRRGEMEK